MKVLHLALVSLFIHPISTLLHAGPPGSDGVPQGAYAWSSDSSDGFPENTPFDKTGSWTKLMAMGGGPNYAWVWSDGEYASADVSLRKIRPEEGETVEEVAQLYAQGINEGEDSEIRQTQLSHQAIILEQTARRGRGKSYILKIFQRGSDIWMLSGSYYGLGDTWEWCQRHVTKYVTQEYQ